MLYEWYCEKCKKEIQPLAVPARLAGGAQAYLCPECSTEWDEFCRGLAAFQELRRLDSVMQSIVHARELSVDDHDPDLSRILTEAQGRELELHQAGLEWLGREV